MCPEYTEAKWLARQDSNLGMAESKSAGLPLADAPPRASVLTVGREKGNKSKTLTPLELGFYL